MLGCGARDARVTPVALKLCDARLPSASGDGPWTLPPVRVGLTASRAWLSQVEAGYNWYARKEEDEEEDVKVENEEEESESVYRRTRT